ncbi:hypothetical protein ZYGR_0N02740 [Zygosaccharomyces rouxii]|uniref:ZYRO0D06644p n=2 Tax=Zygosaccharomyces rouxii TaxID=4956 RepID=C5DVG9_ZYGRC|nr:uncharacterized protein ZYRO0D06644g [Zygosaccharomyces rouxii]KAH9200701.1 hypothetical protein LQ764DRAFT_224193 [Zygosaccharomyces rouxii]GAV48869.1 hypothetical protein ZYGR_0N02740 [Zygosaccharomyces rouxii]CAR27788.1 ZYRO0D06644p [Zygosaccharomyces rouxii]
MSSGDEFGSWESVGQNIPRSLRPELADVLDDMEREAELLDAYDEDEELPLNEGEEEEEEYSDYESDLMDDYYEGQLLDAQKQWEESLDQLNKVLNWILLPLVGKFLGRRVAKTIWKRVMEYCWSGF